MTSRRYPVLLPVAAALFGIAVPVGSFASAETVRVEVKGLTFIPAQIKARVGDTIEWANEDFVTHTATARSGAWDTKLPPHTVGRIVLKQPGKVEYYCRYHPNMKGEIDVAPDRRFQP